MARKIHIDSDNTLQQWIDSQNTMSDYMGNLDSFRPAILNNFTTPLHNTSTGASFVTALNYLYDPLMQNLLNLFNGTGTSNFDELELRVDSATFNILRVNIQDSSVGKNLKGRSTVFAADAHVRDSYEAGDSTGSTGLINSVLNGQSYLIPSFGFDLFIESNATFENMTVSHSFDTILLDSAVFNKIVIIDSSRVDKLVADSNGVVTISQAHILNFHPGQPDSINVSNVLRSTNIIGDSAVIPEVNINNLIVESDLEFDGIRFRTASKFLITDSASPDSANDTGVIYFGGYKLDSV
mgnify:CR=1 FL=1